MNLCELLDITWQGQAVSVFLQKITSESNGYNIARAKSKWEPDFTAAVHDYLQRTVIEQYVDKSSDAKHIVIKIK